jgi:pilus assembly protein CpaB
MKKSLLVFFGFMLGSGGAVTWLALAQSEPAAPVVIAASTPLPPQFEEVLVATHKLSSGSVIQVSDFAWQGWPRNTALRGVIRKSEAPAAMEELKDSVVRGALLEGEPIRREKLAKGGNAGELSAILAPGHSAVAIAIEGGAAADGNAILPNDHVDVLRVTRDKPVSKTLVANVRVLAIAPNAPDKRGRVSATGATATLELDPHQAETVILAQRGGQLSLALSSMQDSRKGDPLIALDEKRERAVAVMRAGAPR